MSCRCRDIGKCSSDIRKIKNAIVRLEQLGNYDFTIETYLCKVAEYSYMSMLPYNISDIAEKESEMNKEIKYGTASILYMLRDEKDSLSYELEDMRDEDYDYHHRDDD